VAVSSLANDDAVRDLVLGADGLMAQMGSRPYVDASTISVALSGELARSSPLFVTLPILGPPQAVRGGQVIYLAGGDFDVIEGLAPMLDSLSGQLKRYDRPEKASTAKLAVNLMFLSGIATVAEALTLGRAGGLSDDELIDVFEDSPMLAPGLKNRFQALVEGSGPTWWTTALAAKDAHLATEAAQGAGRELRLAAVVHQLYQTAAEHGFDDDDIVAVAQLYR
jgi:3-hydroxyisobutyrate dehydrogenase